MSSSHFCGPDIHKTLPNYQAGVSILKITQESLKRNGDSVALIDGDTEERVSCSELLEQSRRIASGLQHAGVAPGDLVVICCDKSILAYSLLLGAMFTGSTVVLAPPPQADRIDKLTSGQVVKALFYDPELGKPVTQSLARMSPPPPLIGVVDKSNANIASLLKCTQEFREFHVEDVTKHVPVVFFSSGTTGHPKGIEISDLGVQLAGVLFRRKLESLLHASPLYWYSALCTFFGSIIEKFVLVITNSKDARNRLRLIETYKVESFFCNMAHMIQYMNKGMFDEFDLSSVKCVWTGGETLLSSVARSFFTKVLKNQASLLILFGSTEAGILCDLEMHDEASIQLGTCGKPVPGVEIKILDDNGDPVGPGVMGRVFAKSLAIKGYWRRDDLNRNFLDGDGFYDTGDAGCFDSEGKLYLRGRICDLIDYRGTKNSPALLEDLLMAHPAVDDAVVIGKPHPSDNQHATAFVVLRPGSSETISPSDIRNYVDERVEDSMRLRGGVHILDSLPRVSNGKVIRKML